jgi:hypothetical protein
MLGDRIQKLTPTKIVNGEVLPEESVTDNPQGADRSRDIHPGEGRDAGSTGYEFGAEGQNLCL